MNPGQSGNTTKSNNKKSNKKFTGNTFLGVRPGTITKASVRKKAEEDKKAAEKRAPIVDRAVKTERFTGNTFTGLKPGRAGKPVNRYKPNPVINNAAIVRNAPTAVDMFNKGIDKADQALFSFVDNINYNKNRLNVPNRIIGRNFVNDYYVSTKPKTAIEQAKNDAKRDTTDDWMVREQAERNGLSRLKRNEIIEWGQTQMYDSESIYAWIEAGITYGEKVRRAQYVENWFNNHNNIRPTWTNDPNSDKGLVAVKQVTETAEMPAWIPPTLENVNKWDYYKTYGFEVNEVNVDAYRKAKQMAVERQINPYSAAYATDHSENAVDSFADVLIKSGNSGTKLILNLNNYLTDYIYNPIIHGHLLTAAGNAVWNLMDTMDIAARGVRAFVAGDVVLGGSGGTWSKDYYDFGKGTYEDYMTGPQGVKHRSGRNPDAKFEGQQVYWAKLPGHTFEEVKKAQRLFMDNGGYALLMRENPAYATKAGLTSKYANMSREDIEAELDRIFATSDISWRDIKAYLDENYFTEYRAFRDLKQAFKNVKKAYTEPDAAFNANTGSLIGDIVLESVLDPGTLAGGFAKGAVKSGVRSAAETAVAEGFRNLGRSDNAIKTIFSNKEVRRAFNEFIAQNEGKNIIFKKSDDILGDINYFMRRVDKQTGLWSNLSDRQAFRRSVYGHLMDKQISVNGKIIANQHFARKALDNKIFKAAYYMDKAIDGIDSAIVKSSFLIPWGAVKATKIGIPAVMNTPLARNIIARRKLRMSQAMNSLIDEATGQINVTNISQVYDFYVSGQIREKDARAALQLAVDQYDSIAFDINGIISDFRAGRISDTDALAAVTSRISSITGGAYMTLDDLSAYIDTLDIQYAGDIKNAYNRIDKAFQRLNNAINTNADEMPNILRNEALTQDLIQEGLAAQSKISDKTLVRKLDINQFKEALESAGFTERFIATSNDRAANKPFEKLETFIKDWEKHPDLTYNNGDILKQIDRFERAAQFSYIVKWDTVSEISAVQAHEVIPQFNALRRKIKKLDMLSLKDTKVITLMHTDRMALQLEYRNRPEVQRMYNEFVTQVIDPVLDSVKHLTSEEMDLMDSDLVQTLQELKSIQRGFNRTNNLIDDIGSLKGFTEDKLNTIISCVPNNFGFHGELEDLLSNPELLRKNLSATLHARTGDSKIGMKSITNDLRSLGTDNVPEYLKAYSDEVKNNPALKQRLNRIIKKSTINPSAYVEKQMIYAALAEPQLVRDWDRAANLGQPQIFWHINTTGLSSELHSMTSISARKWVPLNLADDETLTLERLLDAFDAGETKVFQRRMNDAEFGEITENMLRRMDMKGATREQMLEQYKKMFRAVSREDYVSEEDMIREACAFLKDNSYVMDINGLPQVVTPSLIVHDLDGFNIPYFNSRVKMLDNGLDEADPITNYINNLSYSIRNSQFNTYDRLAEKIGDFAVTDAQLDELVKVFSDYADDMRVYGSEYKFLDTDTYSRKIEDLERKIANKVSAKNATALENKFYDTFHAVDGDVMLGEYKYAVHKIKQLTLEPRGYAFASSDELRVNPTHAALQEAGQDTVNVDSRIYVDDVLSYFNVDAEDGFCVAVEDLKKMNQLSRYIIQNRDHAIVSGAEEYLRKYKPRLDRMLNSMIELANQNAWRSTELGYIADLKIPNTSVETYLMARKLYNDHLRHWLDTDLVNGISADGRKLDELKYQIKMELSKLPKDDPMRNVLNDKKFEQVLDYYNNYRRRFFDELVGGGFNVDELTDIPDLIRTQADAKVDYWNDVSDKCKQIWSDFRQMNAEAKQDMLTTNKQEWDAFAEFRQLVRDRFDLANAQLNREYEELQAAKKAKWERYKQFTAYRDSILAQMKETSDQGKLEVLARKIKKANKEWQKYNREYMYTYFDDITRPRVWEKYRFADPSTGKVYDDLLQEFRHLMPESFEDRHLDMIFYAANAQDVVPASTKATFLRDVKKKDLAQAEKLLDQLFDLAKEADNFEQRKSWLQWHGTPKVLNKRRALRKQKDDILAGKYTIGRGLKTAKKKVRKTIRDTVSQISFEGLKTKEVVDKIDDLARETAAIMNNGDFPGAIDYLYENIEEIFKKAGSVDSSAYDEYADLRHYLQNKRIRPDFNDVTDYNSLRKTNFGRIRLAKDGTDYTEVLQELAEDPTFSTYFSEDIKGFSGFMEAVDEFYEATAPSFIPMEDEEKEYFMDKLFEEVFSTLNANPVYGISTDDEAFAEVYNVYKKNGVPNYESVKKSTDYRYADYRMDIENRYAQAAEDSNMHYIDAEWNYLDFSEQQLQEAYETIDSVNDAFVKESDDFLNVVSGGEDPNIFKKAARSDYETRVATYENGVMKDGLDVSRKCTNARSEMNANLRQLNKIDQFATQLGTYRADQRLIGATHKKAQQLFDILHETGFAKRPTFQRFMERVSELRQLQLQRVRMDALKDASGFNRQRLLEELCHNNFNMTVFNSHCYDISEIHDLRDFVRDCQNKGDNFLSYFEDADTGNVFIYLNNNAIITEADDARWINGTLRVDKPAVKPYTAFAEFDELLPLIDDVSDIEDFRGIYNHLLSCWDDTRMLSYGAINGTSGRVVNSRQVEEFIQTLPDELADWCTSEGLLRSEIARDVVYDPGFVRSDNADVLFDFMDTLHAQADVAKEDTMLINMVFNKNDNLPFSDLADNFTDDELIKYFRENPDYTVCVLQPKPGTATGFEIRQLNLNNKAALDTAKTYEYTTILPYDVYFEMANTMNRTVTDSSARRLLSKYLLAYKAFALVKPGTWMRNYIDATTKAVVDSGGGITEGMEMIHYEAQAARGLGLYSKIAKVDPKLLNEANWDIIQHTFHTDLTYEDFEILKGIVDAEYVVPADRQYLNRTVSNRAGHNVISGQDIGLRNLEEKDIKEAFKKYLSKEDIAFNEEEFLDVYFNGTDNPEVHEAFEDAMRRLSNNLRNADASTLYDKAVRTMFKPFGTVEQLVRYAQTLYLRDMGMSQNQITKRIHMTQFYNAPAWGTWSKLEAIMPFVTYKYNNVMFWIRMIDENPRYFRYFEDIYRNIADDTLENMEERSQSIDYENDYALQNGSIPIGSGKVYFNLGNSFMSAMNDFYGLPQDFYSLNPLLKDSVKLSLYALGFHSKEFFSSVNLDVSGSFKLRNLIPGADLAYKTYGTFKNIAKYCNEDNGPSMDALVAFTNLFGLTGNRYMYDKNGSFDFDDWQTDLMNQGQWYDCNLGKIVPLSEYNEYGANNPNNTFEDIQAYQLLHYGKLWDANQHKFVLPEDYIEGGLNDGYDWENDPEGAWDKLQADMAKKNKIYDYNQRKFVRRPDFIEGGLNDKNISFEKKAQLMAEKFGLYWDGNRNTWIEKDKVIPGGLNDTKNFREVMALRLALFGETYNRDTHHFEVTQKPSILVINNLRDDRFDNYYSRLGIPDLTYISQGINVNKEGLLVTDDGRYILTGDVDIDERIFEKFKHTFDYQRRGFRRYNKWRNYSWRHFTSYPKRSYTPKFYFKKTYYDSYNKEPESFFRFEYQYNYQYHSPQPGRTLHSFTAPRVHYPYGNGFSKYSYYTR